MSLKRRAARMFDRSGGRWILSRLATRMAKRQLGPDASVFYHGVWAHRTGALSVPDGPRFEYSSRLFHEWRGESERWDRDARDYWYQFYTPKTGDVIVDVGAGRGEDVIAFSKSVGPTGRVLAVEAHPRSFELLSHCCRLNGLGNVGPLNVAVMDSPGTVTISDESAWEENAIGPAAPAAGRGLSVRADTLNSICTANGVERIAFLKMNIEGAERYALPGLSGIVDRIDTICVACHDFRADLGHGESFRTRVFVEAFLRENGFAIRSRPDHPLDYVRDHLFGVRTP